ncbi:hypothetical protein GCM10028868_11250 [Virgibacillus kimchii]
MYESIKQDRGYHFPVFIEESNEVEKFIRNELYKGSIICKKFLAK